MAPTGLGSEIAKIDDLDQGLKTSKISDVLRHDGGYAVCQSNGDDARVVNPLAFTTDFAQHTEQLIHAGLPIFEVAQSHRKVVYVAKGL